MTLKVKKELLEWAIERSGRPREDILNEVPMAKEWLDNKSQPRHRGELRKFADATYAPPGFLLMDKPPNEHLPDVVFLKKRTYKKNHSTLPTANEMDSIYDCKAKQQWYRHYCIEKNLEDLEIAGKYKVEQDPVRVAQELTGEFDFNKINASIEEYVELIEQKGIIVILGDIVKGDENRKLSGDDFRGFALPDYNIPVLFVNTQNSVEGMRFVLMHELAHIVIAMDDEAEGSLADNDRRKEIEQWCNKVAVELLVPESEFRSKYEEYQIKQGDLFAYKQQLSEYFGVSTETIVRRIKELGYYHGSEAEFETILKQEKVEVERAYLAGELPMYRQDDPDKALLGRSSKLFCQTLLSNIDDSDTNKYDAMELLNIGDDGDIEKLEKIVGH